MKDITTFGNFFAFCLLILSFACQKDDAGIGSHIEDTGTHINSSRDISSSTYKYVTPDEIPDVIEAYSNYSGKISPKQFRESPNASLIMETTSIDGVKSYSMRLLEKENNPYVLYNLVVKQAPGETPSRPFIVKYETDTPIDEITPESYKNTQWSISTYWANNMELWGEIPKDGNRGAFARTEGIGETGPPCGGSSSSGGGGGGSGSSDSWWTISDYNFGNSNYGSGGGSSGGGGGSGNSTQLICNVRIRVSQYHCNGPNGGTPHPAGPNSGEPGDNKCGDSSTGYGGSGDNIIVELYCTEISMAVEDAPWVREEETHTLDFCEMAEIRDLLQSKASDLDTSQLALLTELENSIENVDLGACVDKASQQERKTLVMKRNEGEEDGPANPEDSDVPDEEVIKDDCPDIDGIGLNSISAEVLEVMNSLLHLEENYEGISKEQTNWILNTKNQSKVAEIHSFLGNNNNSGEAKNFAKEVISLLIQPEILSDNLDDYEQAVLTMATGLRRFHGEEGGDLMASYFETMVKEFPNMTVGEVTDFHRIAKEITIQYNNNLLLKIINAFIEGIKPAVEFALFEAGGTLAIKLLGKLPAVAKTLQITEILNNLKTVSSLSKFKYAQKFGFKTYAEHVAFFDAIKIKRSELGVQIHHLFEKRFAQNQAIANWLGSNANNWKSIVLTKEEHAIFTKAWREAIGYQGQAAGWTTFNTNTATVEGVKKAARSIYKDYPDILKALGL